MSNYRRAVRILKEAGYAPEDSAKMEDAELLRLPWMGKKTIQALREQHPRGRIVAKVFLNDEEDYRLMEEYVQQLGGSVVRED